MKFQHLAAWPFAPAPMLVVVLLAPPTPPAPAAPGVMVLVRPAGDAGACRPHQHHHAGCGLRGVGGADDTTANVGAGATTARRPSVELHRQQVLVGHHRLNFPLEAEWSFVCDMWSRSGGTGAGGRGGRRRVLADEGRDSRKRGKGGGGLEEHRDRHGTSTGSKLGHERDVERDRRRRRPAYPTDPTAASVRHDLEGCGVFVSAPAADGGAADGGGGGGDGTFGNPYTTLARAAHTAIGNPTQEVRVRRGLHDHDHIHSGNVSIYTRYTDCAGTWTWGGAASLATLSRYDQILIDSPPTLAATDASIIGRLVDGVVLVMQPAKNRRRLVLRAAESFTSLGVTLLGVVVNRVGADKQDAIYSVDIQDGYGYGGEEENQSTEDPMNHSDVEPIAGDSLAGA